MEKYDSKTHNNKSLVESTNNQQDFHENIFYNIGKQFSVPKDENEFIKIS